jgi:hypothetical protein
LRAWQHLAGLVCLVLALALPGHGQLSPGKLARPHARLEGLSNCTQCHELGRKVSDERCLVCHTEIRERLSAPRSVHSRKELAGKACASCHSDHHGLDFAMIHWLDGEKGFDHSRTGFLLQEAHGRLECRDCHTPALQAPGFAKRHAGLNPERSYLGLKTDCLACHKDPHRGELGNTCTDCHGVRSWDQLPGFDHRRSWPLEGAHRTVDCAGCHTFPAGLAKAEQINGARRWRGIPSAACTDCHRDPHANRFGSDCLACHSLDSFRGAGEGFDHSRTRWPLTGAHQRVSCAECHGSRRETMRMAFAACDDCHKDPHAGQFRQPTERSRACATCHGDPAWAPAVFGQADHDSLGFALEGAHGAVPCALCHTSVRPGEATRWRGLPGGCVDCHTDPHEARPATAEGCRECHGLESWQVQGFDHGATEFPLNGAHARVSCAACHRAEQPPLKPLKGLARACAACHGDFHDGQFTQGESAGRCEACHNEQSFRSTNFDHQRQSRFPLDGAHRDLACALCHAPRPRAEGRPDRVYRPLGMQCVDCHGGAGRGCFTRSAP